MAWLSQLRGHLLPVLMVVRMVVRMVMVTMVAAAVAMQVLLMKTKTVMVMMMPVALTTTTSMRPVWMLSLYGAFSAQGRTWRCHSPRVKEVSCSDTDRFDTDTNTRRQRHTSQLLMLRPKPPCSSAPSAGCATPRPRGLPPMRLAAVHSALRAIAGSAAKKLPPVTRTRVS